MKTINVNINEYIISYRRRLFEKYLKDEISLEEYAQKMSEVKIMED